MLYSLFQKKIHEICPPQNGLNDDLYGLQFGSWLNKEDFNISKVIVCVDPTESVLIEAIKQKAQLIIAHHGLTYQPLRYFNDLVLDSLKLLSNSNIRLFVMHTAWDAAIEGISESFAKIAGFNLEENFYFPDKGEQKPIGRIGTPFRANTTIKEVADALKRHLSIPHIRIVGLPDHIIKKAVIVGGKGLKSDMIIDVLNSGCDTFITGEFTYSETLIAQQLKLNLIETSHYSSEKIGMMQLQKILSLTFPRDQFIFFESVDPVKYL